MALGLGSRASWHHRGVIPPERVLIPVTHWSQRARSGIDVLVIERSLVRLGRWGEEVFRHAGEIWLLLWQTIVHLVRGRVPWREIVAQMHWMGVRSLPIVMITAVLAGVVTSQQGGYQFQSTIPLYILGSVVTTSVVLELGPVLTAIVLIGRSEEHTSELQSRGHLVCRL